MSVHQHITASKVDLPSLAVWLDALAPEARIAEARSLSAKQQAQLFEAAKGYRPLTLLDFVPEHVGTLSEVIHHGRNSLPAFTTFQKRFCRPPREHAPETELWGYNEQAMRWATGPGYFVTRLADDGEVVIDYYDVPPKGAPRPESWPRVRPNHARLSRFVYHRTRDYMRGVSKHVSIGRAMKDGKVMDNWFVLCRE